MRNTRTVVIVVGVLGILCCCGVGIVALIAVGGAATNTEATETARAALFAPMAQTCSDPQGIADAADLDEGAGVHPVAIFQAIGEETFAAKNAEFPSAWNPATPADTQLVACITQEREVIESCEYTLETSGGDAVIERIQYRSLVMLYGARSGELIAQETLEGSLPEECKDEEEFGEGITRVQRLGDVVPFGEVEQWLKEHVAP